MDPRIPSTSRGRACFPRTRGDGPRLADSIGASDLLPPHARGWTLEVVPKRGSFRASPARAGMDPPRSPAILRPVGFPRTRGDGPACIRRFRLHQRLPPHARGWTAGDLLQQGKRRASPARAGMDPSRSASSGCRCSFPRTRGDGPHIYYAHMADITFPPHARGWTHPHQQHRGPAHVSPARAGMDPWCGPPTSTCSSFPRTRGDGPTWDSRTATPTAFPPHARGWTRQVDDAGLPDRVSPARAGMDLLSRSSA